jgi:hypothetical protein
MGRSYRHRRVDECRCDCDSGGFTASAGAPLCWLRQGGTALACIIMVLASVRDGFALGEDEAATKVGIVGMTENVAVGDRSPSINSTAGLWFCRNHHCVPVERSFGFAFACSEFARAEH